MTCAIEENVLMVLDFEARGEGTTAASVASQVGLTVRQASAALLRLKEKGEVVNGYAEGDARCLWYQADCE